MLPISQVQLGKNGVTDNFIETLKSHFKNHKNVKISVLRSSKRENIKEKAEEIVKKLGKNYIAKTIGFTINLKKWRK